MKNKNQETDGYGSDKKTETEKLKRKEITSLSATVLQDNTVISRMVQMLGLHTPSQN